MGSVSAQLKGLRAVALFEGAKAILILVVGFGLLSLINHDVAQTAEMIVRRLHLNPASHYPQIFLQAAQHVTNANLWAIALLAMLDAVMRAIEAYGLWLDRAWAKWLGLIAAGIYLPVEIYEMVRHFTEFKLATFVTNILIVIYLAYVLRSERHAPTGVQNP